jgi:hypothetical protein
VGVLHLGLPGPTLDHAQAQANLMAELICDVVTLHRDAPATLLVTVVEERGQTRPRQYRVVSHTGSYRGNLLRT